MLVVFALTLAACQEDEEGTPTPTIDILGGIDMERATQQAGTQQALQLTQDAQQTAIALQTQITVTPRPTFAPPRQPNTPTPTEDPATDILGNIVAADDQWQLAPFTGLDGTSYTLADFLGKVVVLMPMTIDCPACEEQRLAVRLVDDEFRKEQRPYDIVYLNLNVNPDESVEALRQWETGMEFVATERFTWLTATASQRLMDALTTAFGSDALDLQRASFIFIDKRGRGHSANNEGVMSMARFRSVMVFYTQQE
jgi:hypothetical protein